MVFTAGTGFGVWANPKSAPNEPKSRLLSLWAYVVGHKRMLVDRYPGLMHLFLFYGFMIPFVIIVITQANFSLPRFLAFPLSLFFDLAGSLGDLGPVYGLVPPLWEEAGNPNL